jgi:hypothetical protein
MVRPPALSDPPAAAPEDLAAQESTGSERCLVCGAPVEADQEWCVECGTARTAIQPPPDWRIGLAIMLATVAVVVLVVVIVWP